MMALNSASGGRTYGTVLSLCFRSNIGCRRCDNRPSALGPLAGLIDWAERSFAEIKAARAAFDAGDTSEQMSAA
jgi:hypothetical protein